MGRPAHDPDQPVSGDALRFRRLLLKLSTEDVARRVGRGRRTVLAWELGERKPNAEQLRALAKVLRCTVGALAVAPRP